MAENVIHAENRFGSNPGHGNHAEGEPIDKWNGAELEKIDRYVQEYVARNKIVDSPKHSERVNLVNRREDTLGKVNESLEGIISSSLGEKVYPDRLTAYKIIEGLVAKGLEADHVKLPEDPEKRHEVIVRYVNQAGVDYIQLVSQVMSTRKPTKVDALPEGHLLKNLVRYIQHNVHSDQRRLDHIERSLISYGAVHAPAVAAAFNKYGGTNLDTRYAKPQEALQSYAQLLQAARIKYDANEPSKVQNVALADKKAA